MPDNVTDIINYRGQASALAAVGSLDNDPDDAAESIRLGQQTGVPATAINDDLDGFKNRYKAHLAGNLVRSNQAIADYVASHPLAASVSNDDWGNLDTFSHGAAKTADFLHALRVNVGKPQDALQQGTLGIVQGTGEGFAEGFGNEPIGQAFYDAIPALQRGTIGAAIGRAGYSIFDLIGRGFQGTTNAMFGAVHQGAAGVARGFGADENTAESFGREAQGLLESEIMRGASGVPEVPNAPNAAFAGARIAGKTQGAMDALHALIAGKPWLDEGIEPPVGVHPEIDKAKADINKIGVDRLEEDLKAAQQSLTKERSPEMFQKFVEQHYGESSIGIHGDAVAALYGDKIPEANDGLLGFTPGIADKLALARETGDDVHIPVKDWISNVDPQVAKGLREDIRVWPGGVTIREAKEPFEPHEVVDSPLAQVRDVSGLEPMFAIGDRKLSLQKSPSLAGLEEFHEYQMLDQDGKPVGELTLLPDEATKQLYVANINGLAGLYSNSFGPSLIRDVKRQLKELYPDYETVTGHRVSGAREAAGVWEDPEIAHPVVKLAKDLNELDTINDHNKFRGILHDAWWRSYGPSLEANVIPSDMYLDREQKIIDSVNEVLGKQIGKNVEIQPTQAIRSPYAAGALGAFQQFHNHVPLILYDLFSEDPIGVARHEGIHFLRAQGFFSDSEWGTLTKAALEEGWMNRYQILDRYPTLNHGFQAEEAIAEAYREWAKNPEAREPNSVVGKIFQKLQDLWDGLRQKLVEILGKEPTWDDLFQKIESGEVAQRQGVEPRNPEAFRPSFAEDRMDNLRAESVGLDLPSYRKLQEQIQKRFEEDLEKANKRAEREQKKRQGAEWKANEAVVRSQVEETIRQRPDVAADLFLSSGELYGDKLEQKYRLAKSDLTEDQQAMLPNHYYANNGLPVDNVARMFGYTSGDAMVRDLSEYNAAKEGKTPQEMLQKVIKDETARQMEAHYGKLDENIMDEAKDQALSETNLNLLIDEYHAAGMRAGVATVDMVALKAQVKEEFAKLTVGDINSNRLLTKVGAHDRVAQRLLIAGRSAEALKSLERKVHTALLTAEAQKFEKEQAKNAKAIKPFAKQWDPTKLQSIDPTTSIFIRDILSKIGEKNGMSPQGLAKAVAHSGFSDLKDFVAKTEKEYEIDGTELPVPDFVMDEDFKTPTKALSVYEYRGVMMGVNSLIHHGRDIQKVDKAGELVDRREWINEANQQIKDKWDPKPFKATKTSLDRGKRNVSAFVQSLTTNETLMSRFDGRDPHGIFTQTITLPGAEGANLKAQLEKDFKKDYEALGPIKNPRKQLDSPFRRPDNDTPVQNFTRQNLAVVISNMGNKYNWNILTKGWKIDPERLRAWVEANSTAEDFDRAQKLGDIFKELKAQDDVVRRNINGVAPEDITVQPFTMHDKEYAGWYHPIIRDPELSAKANGLQLEPEMNFWPSTPNSYIKRRTGAIDVIDLTYDTIPAKFTQIIHSIALNEFVHNTAKIFRDRSFNETIAGHYGREYMDGMNAWLKTVAGNASYNSKALADAAKLSNNVRQNVVSTAIAFNVNTVMKHGVTAAAMSARELGPNLFKTLPLFAKITAEVAPSLFKYAVYDLFGKSQYLGDSTFKFILNNSMEIQRRVRNFQDTLMGQHEILMGKSTLRHHIAEYGAKGVAFSDMLSAAPLWLAKYREAFAESADHGDAVRLADFAVRRAHGSTAITNLPRIVTGNDILTPWMTSLYGFMGTSMQRRIEMFHDINDAWKLGRQGEISAAFKMAPQILSSAAVYIVWTGVVESMVEHIYTDDHRSMGEKFIAGAFGTMAQTIIGLRDLADDLIHDRESTGGLLTAPVHDLLHLKKDLLKKNPLNKANAGKFVQDGITAIGDLFGYGPKHIGTAVHYGIDVFSGQQKPKTGGDVFRGVVSGQQKLRVEK